MLFIVHPLESRLHLAVNSLSVSKLPMMYSDSDGLTLAFGQLRLDWTRADDAPVDGYRVFRQDWRGEWDQIAEVTDAFYIDTYLPTGTRYFYRVRPFTNASGNQASLGTAWKVTDLPMPNVTHYKDDNSFGTSCSIDDNTATHFKIEWAPVGEAYTPENSQIVEAKEEGGAVLFSTAEGGAGDLDAPFYNVRVTAINDVAVSPPNEQTIFLLTAPEAIETTPTLDQRILVEWKCDSARATGFRVEVQNYYDDTLSVVDVPAGKRHAYIDDLPEGVDLVLRVKTISGEHESESSGWVDAQILVPLDREFSRDGDVITMDDYRPVITDLGDFDQAADVAVQSNGKVIVVGTTGGNFAAVRYNEDGSLDETFGNKGKAIIDLGKVEIAHALALKDDNIVIVGSSNDSWGVAFLDSNGNLDKRKVKRGFVRIPMANAIADAQQVVVDKDSGEFLIAGMIHWANGQTDACVKRFSPRMLPLWDDTRGVLHTVTGETMALSRAPRDQILLGAARDDGIVVARFNRYGNPIGSFGERGRAIVPFARNNNEIAGIDVNGTGEIVVAATAYLPTGSTIAAARLTSTGALDEAFNGTGIVTVAFDASDKAQARDVAVMDDGSILAAGSAKGNFAAVRIWPNGELDRSFDRDGIVTTDFGSPADIASTVCLGTSNYFYLAGTSATNFAAARYRVDTVWE
jgi:uncharacterized delta-60 repeat protein